jgi:hypothetical protein
VSVTDCAISYRYGRILVGHIGSTVLGGKGLPELFILLPVTYGCTQCLGVKLTFLHYEQSSLCL